AVTKKPIRGKDATLDRDEEKFTPHRWHFEQDETDEQEIHPKKKDGHRERDNGEPIPGGSGERWEIYNTFHDWSVRYLPRAEIVVWGILFREYKRDKGYTSISMRTLAERAGCSRQAVTEAIYGKKGNKGSGLRCKGLVQIVRTGQYLSGRAEDGTL